MDHNKLVLPTSRTRRQTMAFERGRLTTEDTESTEPALETDPFTGRVIGCAIEVHRGLGPGLLINFSVQRLADGIERFKL